MSAASLVSLGVAAAALALAAVSWRRLRRERDAARAQLAGQQRERREQALELAVSEERARIFADLHDDVGAKLLTLIHSLDNPAQADLARSVLQDFRDIVSRTRDNSGSLLWVLGQIRSETEQRLETANAELVWQADAAIPDPPLDQAQAMHLFRIVREAVSNALRHAQASRIRIRIKAAGDELLLDVTDDGVEAAQPGGDGSGVANMKSRAQQLHGQIAWQPGTAGGTKVLLRFPLPAAAGSAAR